MKCRLFKVGLAMVCLSVAAFATSVSYTETASVANGCTDPVTHNPIVLTDGTCTVNTATSTLQTAYSVSTFTTSGNQMAGMQVTVIFSDGFQETKAWATTNNATGTGGASDTTSGVHNWSLTESGDTFQNDWVLTNNSTTQGANAVSIVGIVLAGLDPTHANCPAGTSAAILCGTVFDRVSPGGDNDNNEQTPNSHRGIDFEVASQSKTSANYVLTAAYSNEFAVTSSNACATTGSTVVERSGANGSPCGDEWAKLTITFNTTSGVGLARTNSINFDIDADTTISSPEPSSIFLSGLGLLAVAGFMKRRRLSRVLATRVTPV